MENPLIARGPWLPTAAVGYRPPSLSVSGATAMIILGVAVANARLSVES